MKPDIMEVNNITNKDIPYEYIQILMHLANDKINDTELITHISNINLIRILLYNFLIEHTELSEDYINKILNKHGNSQK